MAASSLRLGSGACRCSSSAWPSGSRTTKADVKPSAGSASAVNARRDEAEPRVAERARRARDVRRRPASSASARGRWRAGPRGAGRPSRGARYSSSSMPGSGGARSVVMRRRAPATLFRCSCSVPWFVAAAGDPHARARRGRRRRLRSVSATTIAVWSMPRKRSSPGRCHFARALAGREMQDLEHVAVGVLEVEGLDAGRRPGSSRAGAAGRSRRARRGCARSQRVGARHVAHDDRDVLEGAVVAARVDRDRAAARRQVLGELERLVAEPQARDAHAQPEDALEALPARRRRARPRRSARSRGRASRSRRSGRGRRRSCRPGRRPRSRARPVRATGVARARAGRVRAGAAPRAAPRRARAGARPPRAQPEAGAERAHRDRPRRSGVPRCGLGARAGERAVVAAEDAAQGGVLVLQLRAVHALRAAHAHVGLGGAEHAEQRRRQVDPEAASTSSPRPPSRACAPGFMLIPESGASKVIQVATSAPAASPVQRPRRPVREHQHRRHLHERDRRLGDERGRGPARARHGRRPSDRRVRDQHAEHAASTAARRRSRRGTARRRRRRHPGSRSCRAGRRSASPRG